MSVCVFEREKESERERERGTDRSSVRRFFLSQYRLSRASFFASLPRNTRSHPAREKVCVRE